MLCYISHNYRNYTSAGNKAKSDIERIMAEEGFRNVGLRQTSYHNKALSFLITLCGVLKAPFCLRRGDILVLQYPLKKYYTFLCRAAHLRGAKVVALIHDLGAFRRKKLTAAQEQKRLAHADFIVCHNESMKAHLQRNGCKVPLHCLEIFDYLSETAPSSYPTPHKPYSIVYAGNLSRGRSNFLYKLGEEAHNFTVQLFGRGLDQETAKGWKHVSYKGFLPSERFIAEAQADFGLVWDGSSLDRCDGDWGEYLKYNNPHKTSFYLRAGIPVIIWEQAAIAPFIEKHKAGLTINTLRDLDGLLEKISPEDYAELKHNAASLSHKISQGYFTRQALEKAEDYFFLMDNDEKDI